MLAVASSATLSGVQGQAVDVEVHVANGLPGFTIVGLPDTSCREARDRVRAAIISSGMDWPSRRITVNLAPGGIPKVGAGLDLAIAVGVLRASGQLDDVDIAGFAFLGELGLDGSLRPVLGALPIADAITSKIVVVPADNASEVGLLPGDRIRASGCLGSVVESLRCERAWERVEPAPREPRQRRMDLRDVKGQRMAKMVLGIAAAGSHHVLFIGPPGAGKTMLAKRLPDLLPDLTDVEALDVARIYSAAGNLDVRCRGFHTPPFRAPHHGASAAALIGGGSRMVRPGEASLAHEGVLFLDELAEFAPSTLDNLRQPLEDREVRVVRANGSVSYPADFLLVGAMNPCPCGESGEPGACRCGDSAVARYHRRLSGPLVDRFDLRVSVVRPSADELFGSVESESTTELADRVAEARLRAVARSGVPNARLTQSDLEQHARLSHGAQQILEARVAQGSLSARGVSRIRAVARTIADLEGVEGELSAEHISLALACRAELLGRRS